MDAFAFSGNVLIELQGDSALEYLENPGTYSCYKVIGFDEHQILIEDYRLNSKESINSFFQTGDPEIFLTQFNSLAWVEINRRDNGDWLVKLSDPTEDRTDYYLWVAIGIGKTIPAYDYLILESTPLTADRFALFSLYHYAPRNFGSSHSDEHSYVDNLKVLDEPFSQLHQY